MLISFEDISLPKLFFSQVFKTRQSGGITAGRLTNLSGLCQSVRENPGPY